jgi:hypothetical protein
MRGAATMVSMADLQPAAMTNERRSKCAEESRHAQIAREQAMSPEARKAATARMADLNESLRRSTPQRRQ